MKKTAPECLATVARSTVSFCNVSQKVIWYHKHSLITFNKSAFSVFVKEFRSIHFWENSFVTDDGNHALLLDTCHRDIRLVIRREDFFSLLELFDTSLRRLARYS